MKNKNLVKLGSTLIALAMFTSCFMGGTLAKYVTEKDGEDKARVAKWGVEIEAIGSMFKDSYNANNVSIGFDDGFSVDSSDGDKVLAPGTNGKLAEIKITGQPEVAVQITAGPQDGVEKIITASNWVSTSSGYNHYCPVAFKITYNNDEVEIISGLEYAYNTSGGIDSFNSAVSSAIINAIEGEGNNKKNNPDQGVYGPNTDLEELHKDVTIEWYWPFENDTRDSYFDTFFGNYTVNINGHNKTYRELYSEYQNDLYDTELGDKTDNVPEINFSLKITVTQIETFATTN